MVASGGGEISRSPVLTDDDGVATSSAWTLGSAEGTQQVIARANRYELAFTAFAHASPPDDVPELSAGERLVYMRDGAIWQATDAEPRLLLQPVAGISDGAVARDGSIAFVTGASNKVCIAASGESEPQCVRPPGYHNISGLAWSPSGTQLLFSGESVFSACTATPPCLAPCTNLLAIEAATMTVKPVVVDVPDVQCALGASWSPDGSVIAFANRGGIWLVNADGSQPRELKSRVGGSYAVIRVRWSPDGRKFSVSLWDQSQCPWFCDSAVGTVDADGNGLRVVATASAATAQFVGSWPHSAPTWSPDGQRIAFGRSDCSSSWDDPCREDVAVVDANGGRPKPLLNNGTLLAWHER